MSDYNKWSYRFLRVAEEIASWSKDPRRKVGCVIMDSDKNQLSGGFNGLPRLVEDSDIRLNNKLVKLKMILHAEENAVAAAARNGHSLKNSTAYITYHPCAKCTALLIQAGVTTIYAYREDTNQPEWEEDYKLAKEMCAEASVVLIILDK